MEAEPFENAAPILSAETLTINPGALLKIGFSPYGRWISSTPLPKLDNMEVKSPWYNVLERPKGEFHRGHLQAHRGFILSKMW